MTDVVCVQFLDAPVPLMIRATEHQQELLREFTLIHLSDATTKQDVPSRLLEVVERHRREFSSFPFRGGERIALAIERGDARADMEIEMPMAARAAAQELLATLTEADEFCRRGELLTLATPPDLVAFREWFLGQIVRQLDGSPPSPWHDPVDG
jgi:hypothetical protein